MANRENSSFGLTLELKPPQSQRSSTVHREKSLPHTKFKESKSMLGACAFRFPFSSHLSTSTPGSIVTTTGTWSVRTCMLSEAHPPKEMCLRNGIMIFGLELLFAFPEWFMKGQLREPVPHNPSARQCSDLATYHCPVSWEASLVLTLGGIFSLFPICFPRGSLVTWYATHISASRPIWSNGISSPVLPNFF